MILVLPNQPTECNDETKKDFETLMSDPISGDIYLVQKNIYTPDVTLYKVNLKHTQKVYIMKIEMLICIMHYTLMSSYDNIYVRPVHSASRSDG